MNNTFHSHSRDRKIARASSPIAFLACLAICFWVIGCNKDSPTNTFINDKPTQYQFETTGEEFFVSALDEVESIADYAQQTT